jgi:uncharacterized protein (UPF0261 family)
MSTRTPTVLIIGTLDTKGPETSYLQERIEALGCTTLVLDSGILGEADGIVPDVSRQEVAIAAGSTIDAVRNAGSRGAAVERMRIGVRKLALELYAARRIDGVVALGGAEGSVLATAAMKALPLGLPKLLVSPIASGRRPCGMFTGTKDVLVMHSVVDILGLNAVSSHIFDNAAAAIAGMATSFARQSARIGERTSPRKQIAATMLGNTTQPLMIVRRALAERGYDLVIFHANGVGGPAMEELIEQDYFDGVIDFTLSELPGNSVGGFHDGGPTRMDVAGAKGIPQLIVPGCVDFIICPPKHQVPEQFKGRPSYFHNPEFTLVRVTREEQLHVARLLARKLNASTGPVVVVVPTNGLSIANHPNGEFWDPETDALFRAELQSQLRRGVTYMEFDGHINDEAFAHYVLDLALTLFA